MGLAVIFQDVVPFSESRKSAVAGAVRKWKSAVRISKARTYRAAFCTARLETRRLFAQFSAVQRLEGSQLAPSFLPVNACNASKVCACVDWIMTTADPSPTARARAASKTRTCIPGLRLRCLSGSVMIPYLIVRSRILIFLQASVNETFGPARPFLLRSIAFCLGHSRKLKLTLPQIRPASAKPYALSLQSQPLFDGRIAAQLDLAACAQHALPGQSEAAMQHPRH
jgi:hypothetical protein